ncbi:MAG: HAD family hydrolase [Spirochaetes bacterium]|nr:HAD family hydrolase [Spirochaetota bacterium]
MIYIAFDIDGTLYDCSPVVGKAFEQGIDEFLLQYPQCNLHKPTTDAIMKLVGIPVDEIFATLFPTLSQELSQKLNDYCTAKLSNLVLEKKGTILPGVVETIPVLYSKGYGLLTASNGRKEYVEAVLKAYGLSHYFTTIMALEDNNLIDKTQLLGYYKKTLPHYKMLIMVGDRANDMLAAANNNIPFIACAFGHNDKEISHCRWIAYTFYEIPGIVDTIVKEVLKKK